MKLGEVKVHGSTSPVEAWLPFSGSVAFAGGEDDEEALPVSGGPAGKDQGSTFPRKALAGGTPSSSHFGGGLLGIGGMSDEDAPGGGGGAASFTPST